MNKRNEYVDKMKSQLDEMNAQLDVLAKKSKNAKSDMHSKYKQEMANLRERLGRRQSGFRRVEGFPTMSS
ncbi:conserved hypothetical protein [gamma proteobacterium NOR5-3]|nr:conserved hypothetical protein [gamma proteobacterium NOR5-3]